MSRSFLIKTLVRYYKLFENIPGKINSGINKYGEQFT